MPRRRWTFCYHEAGHAVAIWNAGYRFHYVAVQPCGALAPDVGGHVSRLFFITDPRFVNRKKVLELTNNSDQLDDVLNIARTDLFVTVAGPAAHARYRRISIDDAILDGGASDMRQYRDVVDAWFADERIEVWDRTLERCRKFVKNAISGAMIKAVAKKLYTDGVLSFDEVHVICSDVWPRVVEHRDRQLDSRQPKMPPKVLLPEQLRLDL